MRKCGRQLDVALSSPGEAEGVGGLHPAGRERRGGPEAITSLAYHDLVVAVVEVVLSPDLEVVVRHNPGQGR